MKNNIEFACVIIETLYYKHEVYEISGGAIEAASKRPQFLYLLSESIVLIQEHLTP